MVQLHGELGNYRLLLGLGLILLLSAIWPLSNWIAKISDQIDRLLQRRLIATAICVAILVAAHLLIEAHHFRGELYLKFHDEHVYLMQAHMLAHGRLWMHAYPAALRDFFDSFYMIVDRVYAGMYPPGTSIMMLPGIWLGLGHWMMPLLTGSAAAAIFYLVLQQMFGAVRAIVGTLLLVSLTLFMSMSFMVLSEAPLLLAQLICLFAWMRWRETRSRGWLLLLGAAAGFGAITRPADMLCVALAVGIAICFELRKNFRILPKIAATIFVGALPFLAIQIAQNIGISGKWDETAVRYYTDHNYPAPILSFAHVTARDVPPTNCLTKQIAMKDWILPAYEEHWRMSPWQIWYPERLDEIYHQTLPSPLLVMLIPLAILSLGEIRRATIVGAMLLFFAIYTADPLYLRHYSLAIVPAIICLILMGWQALERAFPLARGVILTFMTFAIGTIAIAAAPEFNPLATPLGVASDEYRVVDQILAKLPRRPSLVLFRFDPSLGSYHTDQVYNANVAWPDDALIVRARDLGENENIRLYRYYVDRGQNRDVYLYDRAATRNGKDPVIWLGTAAELTRESETHASR